MLYNWDVKFCVIGIVNWFLLIKLILILWLNLFGIGNSFLKIIGMNIYVMIVFKINIFDVLVEIVFNFFEILVVVIMSDNVDVNKNVDVIVVFILN